MTHGQQRRLFAPTRDLPPVLHRCARCTLVLGTCPRRHCLQRTVCDPCDRAERGYDSIASTIALLPSTDPPKRRSRSL